MDSLLVISKKSEFISASDSTRMTRIERIFTDKYVFYDKSVLSHAFSLPQRLASISAPTMNITGRNGVSFA
jgi:hypothetical protein